MWGKADEKNLKFADGTLIVMDTPWRYKISAPLSQTGGMAHAPWLKESGLSMLYNGMIGPVGPTAMRAAIWYQGESDTWQPKEYGRLLQALIEDWRHKFGTDLPFVIVQLPNFGPPGTKPGKSVWAEVREVQRNVANTTPNTGLAVTIDLGQTDNIHPTNKAELGRRLALVAERLVYGMNVADSGPTPVAAIRYRNTIAVSFAHTEKGLAVYESKRPVSFQVCDIAGLCEFVDATQRGNEIDLDISHLGDPASARVAKQRDKVINPDVPQIGKAATVRYCWADSPLCNVYNSENLPAVPFEIQITQAPQIGKQFVRKPRHHRLRGGKTGM
jgi:sialate O-acetylesterase